MSGELPFAVCGVVFVLMGWMLLRESSDRVGRRLACALGVCGVVLIVGAVLGWWAS